MQSHRPLNAGVFLTGTALVALLAAAPARAQLVQVSLSLNEASLDSEYLSVTNKTGLEGNDNYTIEAWVHPTSFSGFPTIVGNDYHTSFWLGLNAAGRVRFYPRGLGLGGFVESVSAIPLNEWTHIAATYNSAVGHRIYLNGVLDALGSGILGSVGTSPGEMRIGADYESGLPEYFFRGYLDEIRIWNVDRALPDIRATMYVGVGQPGAFASGAYDGLVANWSCEGPFTTAINDYAFPANLAEFENGDVSTHLTFGDPFGPPVAPNVALRLNGIDDHVVLPVTEDFDRGVTVMGWVAPLTFANFPTIAGRDYTSSFWLGLSSTGHLRFYPTGGLFNYIESPQPLPAGRWSHVAATYDNGRTVLFVNGEVVQMSTAISGPVGANGEDVWIGADRESGVLDYAFTGFLDEVKVVQGVLSNQGVKTHMFVGYPAFVNPLSIVDRDGALVPMYHASFDRADPLMVQGSNARLVRGGTGAFRLGMNALSLHPVWEFVTTIVGGVSALPDDDAANAAGADLTWPVSMVVNDVDVFVSAPITDLSTTEIRLESPASTTIRLLAMGDAVGRDLLAVIHDAAIETWATGANPFHDGVRPSEPLSTFNGEPALGTWRLELESNPSSVGLWAWGLRINGVNVAVETPTLKDVALRLEGAHPVRGTGRLAFDLPAAAQVNLGLFDVQGRRVLPLLAGHQQAGAFRMSFSTASLQPGLYFARLLVDGEARGQVRVSIVH